MNALPKELETIIDSDIRFKDIYENISVLRYARLSTKTRECIMISPDNRRGYLGFVYSPNTNDYARIFTAAPGVISIEEGNLTINIHSNRKTWPKGLEYNTICRLVFPRHFLDNM